MTTQKIELYPDIHASDIGTFQRCHRLWFYTSEKWGLGYRGLGENQYITLGNWGHYCLALVALSHPYDRAIEMTLGRQAEMDLARGVDVDRTDLIKKFRALMLEHEAWNKTTDNRYRDDKLEWVLTEQTFKVPLDNQQYVSGTWDGVVRHKGTNGLYVLERKITTRPEDLEVGVQWDWQPRIYMWVAEKLLNEPVRGVIYELIRNCDPTDIPILKNGLPSKSQQAIKGSTYTAYHAALVKGIEDNGYAMHDILLDYEDVLEQLTAFPMRIINRVVPPITKDTKRLERQLQSIAWQMAAERDLGDDVTPTLNRYECGGRFPCGYRDVCLAHDDGADWKQLLEVMYTQDRERM
jgi:hypothetical protein